MGSFRLLEILAGFRAIISFLIIIVTWQSIASLGLVPQKYFPSILAIAAGFRDMMMSGELVSAELRTISRALIGVASASMLGIGLAVLGDLFPSFRRGFAPMIAIRAEVRAPSE